MQCVWVVGKHRIYRLTATHCLHQQSCFVVSMLVLSSLGVKKEMKTVLFPSRVNPVLLTISKSSSSPLALVVGLCLKAGSAGFMGCTSILNPMHWNALCRIWHKRGQILPFMTTLGTVYEPSLFCGVNCNITNKKKKHCMQPKCMKDFITLSKW